MSLRRGFKAEAEWYARDVRQSLGLEACAPLCPWALADHLGYAACSLGEFADAHPGEVALLRRRTGPRGFSAITVCWGENRLIVVNDGHAATRQAADVAHELAHGLLMHEPMPLLGANRSRHYNEVQEEEAHWLGPALLVPYEAALRIARERLPTPDAAARFKVSSRLMEMRLRVTGVLRRVRATA